jgi:putative alpha-1,2-mannosidase
MYFDFDTNENEAIEVKLAISPVSQANAMENLEKEAGSLSFDQVKAKLRKTGIKN